MHQGITAKYRDSGNGQSSPVVAVKQAGGTHIWKDKEKDKCILQR
jgi:hypothetical protein